jgi:hypothetical protein
MQGSRWFSVVFMFVPATDACKPRSSAPDADAEALRADGADA